MQTFIIACVAAIVIAVIGGVALNKVPDSSASAYTTPYVRLGA
jgi:hypothetical protein